MTLLGLPGPNDEDEGSSLTVNLYRAYAHSTSINSWSLHCFISFIVVHFFLLHLIPKNVLSFLWFEQELWITGVQNKAIFSDPDLVNSFGEKILNRKSECHVIKNINEHLLGPFLAIAALFEEELFGGSPGTPGVNSRQQQSNWFNVLIYFLRKQSFMFTNCENSSWSEWKFKIWNWRSTRRAQQRSVLSKQ